MYQHYLPTRLREAIEFYTTCYTHKFVNYLSPYLAITFDEYNNDRFNRSKVYITIENYLGDKSSMDARSMKADYIRDGKSLLFSLGENEEVMDVYHGVKVWWSFNTETTNRQSYWFNGSEDKRSYNLSFHSRHRKFILDSYLPYVLEEGEAIAVRKRRRKLFTNATSEGHDWMDRERMWTHIEFKHPANFNKLAMEKSKKQMIIDDLQWFQTSKDYYSEIGKPWKRGYLLYGPPGTGKSTLVAAMANLLDYDIYDLELTAVKDNIQLRKLLIETLSKSIILIEDIDCSLDLTGQRKKKKKSEEELKLEKDPIKKELKEAEEEKNKGSEVTLSGLLNFIDGIWSACGEERIIVFTTNHIDKLDPALIRRGRMDLHIEMSYCQFESFKVLAKNYLKVESHPCFETIERLLKETNITPADVAENLMPRSFNVSVDDCFKNLITVLEKAKEEARLRSEKEIVTNEETEEQPLNDQAE